MKLKRILAILLAAVMVFSLAACGPSDDSSDGTDADTTTTAAADATGSDFEWNGQKEVWAILPTTSVPGLMMHADTLGWLMKQEGWTYVAKDAQGQAANEVQFINDAIAAGNVGALMIATSDKTAIQDACNNAAAAGIAITLLGADASTLDGKFNVCYVATAYSLTGMYAVQVAEDWVEKRVAEGGNVPTDADGMYEVYIDYYTGIEDGIFRSNALFGEVEASDILTMVASNMSYGESDPQSAAYDNVSTALAGNPDIRIFICYEPDEAMGAAQYIAEYASQNNLDLADFCVISCYSEDPTFMSLYAEALADPSSTAIKGYSTYGGETDEEMLAAFLETSDYTEDYYSQTGITLATQLLGSCGVDGYEWEYGVGYYDNITATDVYFAEGENLVEWDYTQENPAAEYNTSTFNY